MGATGIETVEAACPIKTAIACSREARATPTSIRWARVASSWVSACATSA